MRTTTLVAGIGGIAFGVLTLIGVFLAAPPGGGYKASDITSYVASGHRTAVFIALYLTIIGTLGLICLLARLRGTISAETGDQPVLDSIFWGTGLAAATAAALGWAVEFSVPIAYGFGGNGFSISPSATYAILQVGISMVLGVSGILLGLALIALFLSARAGLPVWLRWVTLIAGLLGLASPAFFLWFALLLWGVIAGVWLLASGRATASSPLVA